MTDTPITKGTVLLPVGPPPSTPADAMTATDAETRNLPLVTTGTSESYIQGLASAVSRAFAADPLTVMFQSEKPPPGQSVADLDLASIQRMVYEEALSRVTTKLAAGGFVAEAAGFAAVACWEPRKVAGQLYAPHASVLAQRPLFAWVSGGWADMMRRYLYPVAERVSGGRYWKLSLMARDPAVEYVPGAGEYLFSDIALPPFN